MDESVVVLRMIFNISMAHILYVSAKTSGGFYDVVENIGTVFIYNQRKLHRS
jgi:hypothetical protein